MKLSSPERKTLDAYNRIAAQRKSTLSDMDFWKKEFERFQKLMPSGRIIDIGCGPGRDAHLFLKAGYGYTGIDFSDEMLKLARGDAPCGRFMKMSMYSLEFKSDDFDGFWAAASLIHIPKRNLISVLTETKRVIKSGGIGFITVKEGDGERMVEYPNPVGDRFYAFYQNKEFSDILEKEGFEILEHSVDTRQPNAKWLIYYVKLKNKVSTK